MTTRLTYVRMSDEMRDAIYLLATQDFRDPRDETTVLLLEALQARGITVTPRPATPPEAVP